MVSRNFGTGIGRLSVIVAVVKAEVRGRSCSICATYHCPPHAGPIRSAPLVLSLLAAAM